MAQVARARVRVCLEVRGPLEPSRPAEEEAPLEASAGRAAPLQGPRAAWAARDMEIQAWIPSWEAVAAAAESGFQGASRDTEEEAVEPSSSSHWSKFTSAAWA